MKQLGPVLLYFTIGLAGGLVSAVVVSSPSGGSDDQPVAGSSEEGLLASRVKSLQDELALLRDDVSQQHNAMRILDSRLAGIQDSGPDSLGGMDIPDADALAALSPADMPSGMAFDAAVNAAIEKREADEAAEREEQRAVRRAEQLDRQMERYTQELGLDADQASQMKTILSETTEARNAFFSEMRESGTMDREMIREKMG